MAIKKITVFQAKDQRTFSTELEATTHETKLDVLSIFQELDVVDVRRIELDDLSEAFLRNLVVLGVKANEIINANKQIRTIEKM